MRTRFKLCVSRKGVMRKQGIRIAPDLSEDTNAEMTRARIMEGRRVERFR
jgi:hypothetical protein